MMRTRRALLTVLAAGLGACSTSPSGPITASGTYVLRTVAGAALPAPVATAQWGGRYLADTLRFEPRSFALFAGPTVERSGLRETPAGELQPRSEHVAYSRAGRTLTFLYYCPPDADCAPGEFLRGTLAGDRLEIELPAPYLSPLRYELLH